MHPPAELRECAIRTKAAKPRPSPGQARPSPGPAPTRRLGNRQRSRLAGQHGYRQGSHPHESTPRSGPYVRRDV
jgi:hypothetical protein